ncbi:MAG: hypothetical protein WCF17_11020 [Terracidiphilus sp.]
MTFSRTQNENGTFNTRCLYCFMTVASSVESEFELDDVEAHHACPEKVLAELVALYAPRSNQARPS